MTTFKNSIFFALSLLATASLAQVKAQFKAEKSAQWDSLFIKNEGWFGGDGIFAIPLDGREFVPATEKTETLLIFSDTMVGKLSGDSLISGDFSMVNNSLAILKGPEPDEEKINFIWNEHEGKPTAIFTPVQSGSEKSYFWLGDGFVNTEADSTLYIFAYTIVNTHTGQFPFKQTGISLIAIDRTEQPPYSNYQLIETPFSDDTLGSFGCGIYVNTKSAGAPNPDGYIYIYGVKDSDKKLVVARVSPLQFASFDQWQFWDGYNWSDDVKSAYAVTKHVSNELSLSPLPNGKMLLAYQYKGIYPEVAVQVGDSPTGPFEPVRKVWITEENKEDKDFFTYNAKAHPHLSSEGSVLISYNVNSFDFWNDILKKPNLYRPRFIRLQLTK